MKLKHPFLALLFTLYLLIPAMVYAKDNPVKFTITWPVDWQVAKPEKQMIGSDESYLVVATKVIDSEPKAFLLVHETPIDFKGAAYLKRFLSSTIKQLKSALEAEEFEIDVEKKGSLKFNGYDALEATLLIKNDDVTMTQRLITVLTGKKGYGITIIIIGDNDKETQKEINKSLATLELF